MGYYADVSGHIDFARSLRPDETKTLEELLESGWYDFEDGLNRSTSCRDVDFWSGDKYYYDTEDMLNRIAEKLPVKSGVVECHGEDGDHWKFQFKQRIPHGVFQEVRGRVVYEDELPVAENDRMELIGQFIDVFEDFLDEKGIVIPNEDRDNDPGEEHANIYGDDYDWLQGGIEDTLTAWHILEPQREVFA
jgi:hypothetical protein